LNSIYFIVALSGGSIRGIFQMEIWDILTEKFPDLSKKVNLYAGSSVGAISGGSLAAGLPISKIKNLFLKRVPEVLKQSFIRKIAGGWLLANYDVQKLLNELEKEYRGITLGHLHELSVTAKDFLCTAFILDNRKDGLAQSWKEKIFETLTGNDAKEPLSRVVAMSSAAPSEFASVADGRGSAGFDGGLWTVHPIMAAIGQTQDSRNKIGIMPIENVRGLLIGTGINPEHFISGTKHDYGKVQLITNKLMPDGLIDGVSGSSVYLAGKWLGKENFHYIDVLLPEDIGFGDMDKMPLLQEIARDMASDGRLDESYRFIEKRVL